MLDILGNVFGRSKKEKSIPGPGSPSTASSADAASDGFAVVGQDTSSQNAFIYPTMLTNEMLRPSTASGNTSASSSSTTTPFSTQNANTWNSHIESSTLLRGQNMNGMSQVNAMDQVPFVPHGAYDSARNPPGSDPKAEEIRRCNASIERVTGFLAAPSQSEYNFSLERSVIRDSSASSWQTFG